MNSVEPEDADPIYVAQLRNLQQMIRVGEESLDEGEGRELDVQALLARVNERLLRGERRESLP